MSSGVGVVFLARTWLSKGPGASLSRQMLSVTRPLSTIRSYTPSPPGRVAKLQESVRGTTPVQETICRIRVEQSASQSLLLTDCSNVPIETRDQWVRSISEQFGSRKLDDRCGIRDWVLILSLDGSAKNSAGNTSVPSPLTRVYPARYRIPNVIIERLDPSKDKVERAEQFALGGLLYQVLSGKEIFSRDKRWERIESCLIKGRFPEDVWEMRKAARILECWRPRFAKEDKSLRSKAAGYIREHPIRFSLQVAGGIACLASILALPILRAVGFGAAGPFFGSVAAAWQSRIGLVKADSIFAWCESAAMGGAAVGGILATGLTGAGVAVWATLRGASNGADATVLKEKFLTAWKNDIGET